MRGYLEYISTCLGWKYSIGLPEHENSQFKSDPRQDIRLSLSTLQCLMHVRSPAIGQLQQSYKCKPEQAKTSNPKS